MDINILYVSLIAIFCGFFAGMLGSPGFTLIVPLLMITGVVSDFNAALGIFFIGVVLPDIVNAIGYFVENKKIINMKLSIIFTLIFAIFTGISVCYCSYYISDQKKLYFASLIQIFSGVWYFLYTRNNYGF